jgi:hypothetical protein
MHSSWQPQPVIGAADGARSRSTCNCTEPAQIARTDAGSAWCCPEGIQRLRYPVQNVKLRRRVSADGHAA